MILPTIHMNGTSREELVAQLEFASMALETAYQTLKRAAPNGRDYYPQGPEAIGVATAEHMARLKKLDEVKHEVDRLMLGIDRIP